MTPTLPERISSLISRNTSNQPITASQIATTCTCHERTVNRITAALLRAGAPIAASCNPSAPGYYRATQSELRTYQASLRDRGTNTLARSKLARKAAEHYEQPYLV